jgi:hypothetical protein
MRHGDRSLAPLHYREGKTKKVVAIGFIILSSAVCSLTPKTKKPLFYFYYVHRSWGSSVSIVSDYGLHNQGSIPDRGRGFFF